MGVEHVPAQIWPEEREAERESHTAGRHELMMMVRDMNMAGRIVELERLEYGCGGLAYIS